MRYLPKSPQERQDMLAALGMERPEDLFAHLPADVRLGRALEIPPGKSEYEIIDYFKARAAESGEGYPSFLGAGVYRHFRPVVIDPLVTRGEFLTSYTPYQAEISQGVLTTIFEFQTMVAQLTGMEVANASMYDGSTATPEAAMMAIRLTGRDKVLAAGSLHPEYRQVLDTNFQHQPFPVETVGYDPKTGRLDLADLEAKLDNETAAFILQSPNFFGVIEDVKAVAKLVHAVGAKLVVMFTEAVSLGALAPPEDADIVAGELQSFAHPPSYGGPYCGVLATKREYIRQIPGRLAGQTVDSDGNRAFCLTLSTREQHIRRAKATSNICTNQALVALMGAVFMSVYGKQGLRELAAQNVAKARYLASALSAKGAEPVFSGPYFNEFVVRPRVSPSKVNERALENRIIGGLDLGRFFPELEGAMLVCATEMTTREQIDRFAEAFA
ncbi:MAG: aminomethyl-transferring glycine dehydrogenase subunit GcvPA [Bryobacterales bacterium]|nr:aminomethyl-transferring glycine dehydrogenase subunit GcvPA [Acidobacteriota bacterium]MCB9384889.1 aminomethyl-transferring glycine dehydrogenase subunit GcvPA [Bryobacterales bacterium]